ncbi:hypothetical protein Taro_056052 [Colocasia esculenta]|uniref:Uncharacterized protein n=1 Tax=Colocasia esculenta TaxID=4460 RepID=A0A843XVC6_COLES|nr:hypothetical protein [Colocasia esculenta]
MMKKRSMCRHSLKWCRH